MKFRKTFRQNKKIKKQLNLFGGSKTESHSVTFSMSLSCDPIANLKFAKLIVELKLISKYDIEGGFKAS